MSISEAYNKALKDLENDMDEFARNVVVAGNVVGIQKRDNIYIKNLTTIQNINQNNISNIKTAIATKIADYKRNIASNQDTLEDFAKKLAYIYYIKLLLVVYVHIIAKELEVTASATSTTSSKLSTLEDENKALKALLSASIPLIAGVSELPLLSTSKSS